MSANEVTVTKHAAEQAQRRFNVTHKLASGWVRARFREAQYIGEVLDENDREGRLFAINRVCLIVDTHEDRVITVYERTTAPESLRRKVARVVDAEKARAAIKVERQQRYNQLAQAEINLEIAELELRLLRARSTAKKLAYQARLNALKQAPELLDADLTEAKREQSTLLKGVACYV